VIAFQVGDTTTTHRLLEVGRDGTLVTKGDAVDQVDPFPVTEADVIGRVVGTVPELGYWLVYLQQPVGMFSVLAAGIGLWLVWSVANDLGRDRPDDSDEAADPTGDQQPDEDPAPDLAPEPDHVLVTT
jgi:signal peptidase